MIGVNGLVNKAERTKDLEVLITNLDISQTMVDNATEKYQNMASYLQSKGIEADIYPQGSFAIGIIVRPYVQATEKKYDLDFICQVNGNKNGYSPSEIKHLIGDALKASDVYCDKMDPEYDRCWTVNYADVGNIGFSMDIVPAIEEDGPSKAQLQLNADHPELMATAIALTEKNGNEYAWLTNNPRGYKEWFDNSNKRFVDNVRYNFYNENRSFYASVEDIPDNIGKTPLQKVIQILKRHRDVYFIKREMEDRKPISAVITTLVADIAEMAPVDLSMLDLLEYVTNELAIYSNRQLMEYSEFSRRFSNRNLIQKGADNKWVLKNPANPEDNLVDYWNGDSMNVRLFFEWIEAVRKDFSTALDKEDEQFFAGLENAFGSSFVRKSINSENYSKKKPETMLNPAKPWRESI